MPSDVISLSAMTPDQTIVSIDEVLSIIDNKDDRRILIDQQLTDQPLLSASGSYHSLMNLTLSHILPFINTWRNNWINIIEPKLNQIIGMESFRSIIDSSCNWSKDIHQAVTISYIEVRI